MLLIKPFVWWRSRYCRRRRVFFLDPCLVFVSGYVCHSHLWPYFQSSEWKYLLDWFPFSFQTSFHLKRFFTFGTVCCLATHLTHCASGSLSWNSFEINYCRLVSTSAFFFSQTCQVRVWIKWKSIIFVIISGDAISVAEWLRVQNKKSEEDCRFKSSILPLAGFVLQFYFYPSRFQSDLGYSFHY